MPEFRDTEGRAWRVEINVTTLKRVKVDLGLDLGDEAVAGTLYAKLVNDPILLCDLLYVVCRDQAEEREIGDEAFGRGLGGVCLDNATAALIEALVNFTPSPQRRRRLEVAIRKTETLMELADQDIVSKLEGDGLEQEMRKRLASFNSVTSSGESSD